MATPDPQSPVRADHRFIKRVMSSLLGGKVEDVPEEFNLISRVFSKAGGSWQRLFNGSPDDIGLIKRIVRRANNIGKLTKHYEWGAK